MSRRAPDGITRVAVRIDFGKVWVTNGELTSPSEVKRSLPIVVMLHGSGRNGMNRTVVDQ
ncbi:hypothetical protein ACWDHW_34790 [Streptomyces melanosporofaciens]|uniref:hypothetical protein n=1 Tax=unclassified Streptomyces TaxID=2593676 RepID=UPI003696D2CB